MDFFKTVVIFVILLQRNLLRNVKLRKNIKRQSIFFHTNLNYDFERQCAFTQSYDFELQLVFCQDFTAFFVAISNSIFILNKP